MELEIKTARKKEKKQERQKIFPITLINHEKLKKWDSYKESFERILRDLKGES